MSQRKPKFDPNSAKARNLAKLNAERRAREAAALPPGDSPTTDDFNDWNARQGMVARDFPGVGRVVLTRQRKYGTRKVHFTAKLRIEGDDLFDWQPLQVPPAKSRDQQTAMLWAEEWARKVAAAEPTRAELLRAAARGEVPALRFVDEAGSHTPGPIAQAVATLLFDGPPPSHDSLPRVHGESKSAIIEELYGDEIEDL